MKARRVAVVFTLLAALRLSAAEKPAPPPIRITLLGTGNPRPSMTRFGPSILVEAGPLVVGHDLMSIEIAEKITITKREEKFESETQPPEAALSSTPPRAGRRALAS